VGGPRANRDLFNLFAAYRQRKLRLSAEYLSGKARLLDNTGLREISGYYGAAGYFIRPKLEAALRHDSFNSNRTLSNATVHELTLGLNYTIKDNTKIQTNLIRHDGSAAVAVAGLRPDSTELRTQFQVAF
jgi:phosphate-selective porin